MSAAVVRLDSSAETVLVWCTECSYRVLLPAVRRAEAERLKHEHTLTEAATRTREGRRPRGRPLIARREPGERDRRTAALRDALLRIVADENEPIGRAVIVARLGCLGVEWTSAALARRLRELVADGALAADGYGRWMTYRAL
ncbi:hypothetical protein [Microbacterium capsulatum]|uniref:DUF2087 domain-containing protein n=1 Tax=Microbacterium capsulatum TaxID=3041921 RepID=A0ABU0XBY0_9MICO|nr:hypothetical protein [Microbacterium sp. ASV81]MDQ4212467.1 hypothetical protein [Microbacterium sp. ASV81]